MLVDESMQRIRERLDDPSCAGAIGASSSASAQAKLGSTLISTTGGQLGTQSLGPLTTKPDGTYSDGLAIAAYSPQSGIIGLNTNVNFATAATLVCMTDGTDCHMVDLAQGNALAIGAGSMSPEQFLDLTLLHELGHAFGIEHPGDKIVDGIISNDSNGYERGIWSLCFH